MLIMRGQRNNSPAGAEREPGQPPGFAALDPGYGLVGRLVNCIAGAVLLASSQPASAQSPEQFFKGKTVDAIIGFAAGGGNDLYVRSVARHMGKHIPGNPAVVARNMPGAGTMLATNLVANVARRDGTTLALGAS